MNSSMINKIAKAKRYAEEPERIQFNRFEATFRGENDVHTTTYDNGEWNCTVIPSHHESFGLAAIESLACGTPVVATQVGGLKALIRQGETGYLVPRCPGFFAERLDTLLQNPELLKQMRLAARPSVLQFSWKHVASEVQDMYECLINAEARQLVAL